MAVIAGRGVGVGRAGSDIASGTSNNNVSQREDLANFISMITRDETPFMSSIGKTKATAIFHEWQTDELARPGNSKLVEGSDYEIPTGYTTDAAEPFLVTGTSTDGLPSGGLGQTGNGPAFAHSGPNRTRLGNYCQINGKAISISGTRRAIDQAGVADEYAYQLKKRGTELRRDLERDMIHTYQTSGVAASGTPPVPTGSAARSFGGYQAWINDARTCEYASGTAVAAGSAGIGTTAPTLAAGGSRAALSLSQMDSVMQKIYEEGGKANKIMVSPKLRRDFSDLMITDSGVRRNIDMDGKLRQSVDVYMSDFGDLMVIPNYIMGLRTNASATAAGEMKDSCALVYDSQWFSVATLRPLQEVDIGQRGDSTVGMMVEEMTLEVKNPLGCGAIYGLV